MISSVLAVALGLAVQDNARLLLPGYADLPAIAGDANCGPSEPGADCVIVRVETINEVFYEYVGCWSNRAGCSMAGRRSSSISSGSGQMAAVKASTWPRSPISK